MQIPPCWSLPSLACSSRVAIRVRFIANKMNRISECQNYWTNENENESTHRHVGITFAPLITSIFCYTRRLPACQRHHSPTAGGFPAYQHVSYTTNHYRLHVPNRAFAAAGQRLWNGLPAELRQPCDVSLGQFRRALKTHLFCMLMTVSPCDFLFYDAVNNYTFLLTY